MGTPPLPMVIRRSNTTARSWGNTHELHEVPCLYPYDLNHRAIPTAIVHFAAMPRHVPDAVCPVHCLREEVQAAPYIVDRETRCISPKLGV